VVGYPVDLEAVQLLFTSLLVQAQHALRLAASRSGPGDRPGSQGLRSAFLLGFAGRISGRLEQANRTAYADAASSSTAFLPVLRSREERIDEFIDERWGKLTSGRVRGGIDGAGWGERQHRRRRGRTHLRQARIPVMNAQLCAPLLLCAWRC
jgi:hypothetical protein